MNKLARVRFSILGLVQKGASQRSERIGDALFCFQAGTLNEKSKFLLTFQKGPLPYLKTYLVPKDGCVLDSVFESIFRVCGSMQHLDGAKTSYGLGSLVPVRGSLLPDTFYYELVPDFATAVWHSGRFLAHLDPFELADYATLSNAA